MIHPREIEIINILCGSECALSSGEIAECGNKLSQSTIQAVLRKLLNEGLIAVDGTTYSGNVLSRTYIPTEAAKQAVKQQIVEMCKSVMNIVPAEELIKELENILKQKRQE